MKIKKGNHMDWERELVICGLLFLKQTKPADLSIA